MIKKILQYLIAIFLVIPLMAQPYEVKLETLTDKTPGTHNVDLSLLGFTDTNRPVGAITLYIEYDDNLLTYNNYTLHFPNNIVINANYQGNSVLKLEWTNMNNNQIMDGPFITLEFDYTGGFDAELNFLDGYEIADTDGLPFDLDTTNFTNGGIKATNDPNEIDGTLMLESQISAVDNKVVVPVKVKENSVFDGAAYAMDLEIAYDTDRLTYTGHQNNNIGFVTEDNEIIVENGIIALTISDTNPLNLDASTPLVELKFDYITDGPAAIEFRPGSQVVGQDGSSILSTEFVSVVTVKLAATVVRTHVTCHGADDGTITISGTTGGSGNYKYSIDGGDTWHLNGEFTNLGPDTYDIRIKDTDEPVRITILGDRVINQPAILNANVASTNVTCHGASDGTIKISGATGGSGTFEYSIGSGSWTTADTFAGLDAGNYSVKIRNAAQTNCVVTLDDDRVIEQPNKLAATVNHTHVTGLDEADGTITISDATGGSGNFEFSINGGDTWQQDGEFTNLNPGNYNVRIRDANETNCFVVLEPALNITTMFTINLSAEPQEGGAVEGDDTYKQGTLIAVVATPEEGYRFTGWREGGNIVSFNRTYTFTVNRDRELKAHFNQKSYRVTLATNPPNNLGGSARGAGTFAHGSEVTVTAVESIGYTFSNWTENGSNVTNTKVYTFTVTSDRNLVANFDGDTHQITLKANNDDYGTVTGTGSYFENDLVSVKATPNDGYSFMYWLDSDPEFGPVSNNRTYMFSATKSRTLTAMFREDPQGKYITGNQKNNQVTITAVAVPPEAGFISGEGIYDVGSTVTLTVIQMYGYDFSAWTDADTYFLSDEKIYTFTATTTTTNFSAVFGGETYTVTVTANPDEDDQGVEVNNAYFFAGQLATVNATPPDGWEFINWTDDNEQQRSANATYTFTVTESISLTGNFEQAEPITYTLTVSAAVDACDLDDQDALKAAFDTWLTEQTDALDVQGGCDPQVSHNWNEVYPQLCVSEVVEITWTISDNCFEDNILVTATFTLNAPATISYTATLDNETKDACDFANQGELEDAFNKWLNDQTAAFYVAGGCPPDVTNDWDWDNNHLVLCDGGTVTVTWTITDICKTVSTTATFTLTKPATISYTATLDDKTKSACKFDNQAALEDAFDAWLTAQTDKFYVEGGCEEEPKVENNWNAQYPQLCDGGTVTVTWTITDLCETVSTTATFTLTKPDPISYTATLESKTKDACDFADQAALEAAFDAWLDAQTASITITSGGCTEPKPKIAHSWNAPYLQLCQGGTVRVVWTITDICETIGNISATFTLNKPDAITYTGPVGVTTDSSSISNQEDLNTAFNNWLADQTGTISNSLQKGCEPKVAHNWVNNNNYPDHGSNVMQTINVTWTITDLCETIPLNARFVYEPDGAIAWTNPNDTLVSACSLDDQKALEDAFDEWLADQTGTISNSLTQNATLAAGNGDWNGEYPVLCESQDIKVTWRIKDSNGTVTATTAATFSLKAPDPISFTDPVDFYFTSGDIKTEFDNWVEAQTNAINNSLTGGCDPAVENNSSGVTITDIEEGDGFKKEVTWTIKDDNNVCETIEKTATFYYLCPKPEHLTLKSNLTVVINGDKQCDDHTHVNVQNKLEIKEDVRLIVELGDYRPKPGETFEIFTYGTLEGGFSNLKLFKSACGNVTFIINNGNEKQPTIDLTVLGSTFKTIFKTTGGQPE